MSMEGRHYTITAVTVTTGKVEDALTHLRYSARAPEEVKFKLDMREESDFAQSHGDVNSGVKIALQAGRTAHGKAYRQEGIRLPE